MIQSMIGYGRAATIYKGEKINVKIRSLNSKSLNFSTCIAPLYREKELEIRQQVTRALRRGKIDFSIWIEKDASTDLSPINSKVVENHYKRIKQIAAITGLPKPQDWFRTLLSLPNVTIKAETEVLDDEEWAAAQKTTTGTLNQLIGFRKQEGAALRREFTEKLDNITNLLNEIEPYEKLRVGRIRARIVDGLSQVPDVEHDKSRLEQGLIYYIGKLDIDEEKQQLTSHLKYFRTIMSENKPIGKKLGFIAQEMGREINTTESKSNLAELQSIMMRIKGELEQIKEQVFNTL